MELKYYILGFLTAVVLITVVFFGFLLGRKNAIKKPVEIANQVTPTTNILVKATETPVPTVQILTESEVREKIMTAVESKKYDTLTSLFVSMVNIRIEASECCSPMVPNEAVKQLDYLKSALGPWDFGESNKIAVDLAATYPEHYDNAIIGISSNNYLISVQLDENNKIKKISLASNAKMLVP